MQIYHSTSRTNDLLKYWQKGDLKIIGNMSPDLKWSFSLQGGDDQNLALITITLAKMTEGHTLEQIENTDMRELDFFLRDKNSEAIFLQPPYDLLFKAKELLFCSAFRAIKELSFQSGDEQELSFYTALAIYKFTHKLESNSIKIYEIDSDSPDEILVVLDFNATLKNKVQHLDKLGAYFIELFQDHKINVIPV